MTITPQEMLTRCIEYREAFHDEMPYLMRLIMHNEISSITVAALTMGPRVKKGIIDEIVAAATVMCEFATKISMSVEVSDHFADIADTGGDDANTFNVFTAPMFVATATGTRIAKRGGHDVSSKSGNADALEMLGVNIMSTPEQVTESIETVGIGSMFAPNHHPAMKNVASIRKELGVRTVSNILEPSTNPAGTPDILMGVFYPDLAGIQVRVVQRSGAKHVVIVYGKDGMDEASLGAAMLVGELKDGAVIKYEIHLEDFGLWIVPNRGLKVADADEPEAMLIEVLEDKPDAPREIVSLSIGVTLYATNIAGSIGDGMKLAHKAIASSVTHAKLGEFVHVANQPKT